MQIDLIPSNIHVQQTEIKYCLKKFKEYVQGPTTSPSIFCLFVSCFKKVDGYFYGTASSNVADNR